MANLDNKICEFNNADNVLPIYPIDMVNSSIVPCTNSGTENSDSDDEDEEDCKSDESTDSALAVCSDNALPAGSAVRINNSSDVVIGPLTRIHGPVTIYQNVIPKVPVDCNDNKSSKPTVTEPSPIEKKLSLLEILEKTSAKRLLLYSIIALSVFIVIAFGIILALKHYTHIESGDGKTISYQHTDRTVSIKNHTVYNREAWGGHRVLNGTQLLNIPVEYVLVAHTAGSFCTTFNECSSKVKHMQTWDKTKGFDIRYNFLIGGDGDIYVGKGWDLKSFAGDNFITVSFIGNFVNTQLPSIMVSALKEFLFLGVELGKLRTDYKIVCHNQTQPTYSPGVNVYEEISQLPHFFKGYVKL